MDSFNWVIQLFEYEQLSTLIKLIERMWQMFVNTPANIYWSSRRLQDMS